MLPDTLCTPLPHEKASSSQMDQGYRHPPSPHGDINIFFYFFPCTSWRYHWWIRRSNGSGWLLGRSRPRKAQEVFAGVHCASDYRHGRRVGTRRRHLVQDPAYAQSLCYPVVDMARLAQGCFPGYDKSFRIWTVLRIRVPGACRSCGRMCSSNSQLPRMRREGLCFRGWISAQAVYLAFRVHGRQCHLLCERCDLGPGSQRRGTVYSHWQEGRQDLHQLHLEQTFFFLFCPFQPIFAFLTSKAKKKQTAKQSFFALPSFRHRPFFCIIYRLFVQQVERFFNPIFHTRCIYSLSKLQATTSLTFVR